MFFLNPQNPSPIQELPEQLREAVSILPVQQSPPSKSPQQDSLRTTSQEGLGSWTAAGMRPRAWGLGPETRTVRTGPAAEMALGGGARGAGREGRAVGSAVGSTGDAVHAALLFCAAVAVPRLPLARELGRSNSVLQRNLHKVKGMGRMGILMDGMPSDTGKKVPKNRFHFRRLHGRGGGSGVLMETSSTGGRKTPNENSGINE